MTKYPSAFYLWLVNQFVSSDMMGYNYYHHNYQAEYGISIDDYLTQYETDAIEDGKKYLENTSYTVKELLTIWQNHLLNDLAVISAELEFIKKELNS